jgi:pimeloyl-ACP methyl ester carboxylesterase
MTKIFRNAIAEDYQERMQNIDIPTLMIWGQDDDQTPIIDAQTIHKNIKNSQLHILA